MTAIASLFSNRPAQFLFTSSTPSLKLANNDQFSLRFGKEPQLELDPMLSREEADTISKMYKQYGSELAQSKAIQKIQFKKAPHQPITAHIELTDSTQKALLPHTSYLQQFEEETLPCFAVGIISSALKITNQARHKAALPVIHARGAEAGLLETQLRQPKHQAVLNKNFEGITGVVSAITLTPQEAIINMSPEVQKLSLYGDPIIRIGRLGSEEPMEDLVEQMVKAIDLRTQPPLSFLPGEIKTTNFSARA